MTWELAAFLVLGVALAAGFVWYERSHPSAKTLALVATLAALGVIGRIAFAPIPNVKPTTDIVLVAGFALGGAPGFMVGAMTALVSNFFFGQGPWTPWQMIAWGGVGLLGAALGHVLRHRIRRLPLALVCAFAGLAFGLVMNFSTWLTFGAGQGLGGLLAICVTALWFDVSHAVGNFLFALALGPLLIRTLMRFRARSEVVWRSLPSSTAPVAVLLTATLAIAGAAVAGARADGRGRAMPAARQLLTQPGSGARAVWKS